MIKCPHCRRKVQGQDLLSGVCSHCNRSLSIDDEGSIGLGSKKYFDKQVRDASQPSRIPSEPIRLDKTREDSIEDPQEREELGNAATIMSEEFVTADSIPDTGEDWTRATAVSADEDLSGEDGGAAATVDSANDIANSNATVETDQQEQHENDLGATFISDDVPEAILATEQSDGEFGGAEDDADKTFVSEDGFGGHLKTDDIEIHMRTYVVETANGIDDGADADKTFISDEVPERLMKTVESLWGPLEEAVPSQPFFPSPNSPTVATPGTPKKGNPVPQQKQTLVIKTKAFSDVAPRTGGGTRSKEEDPEYELLKVLGEGGMGIVYDARQTSIDRNVAVKMLKPKTAENQKQRAKFLAEAVVTGELDHPNIVPIYDVGANSEGALFYSMKKVQGTPWLKVIKQKSIPENLEILMKIADAVGFAHARGVVHRDLKPENVMLGEFGEVLVMDWGLAQPSKTFRKSSSITETNTMGGTPAYMAPEMTTGPIERIGPASDVYLLGAMLFEILTGTPPHVAKNAMKCLMAAARNEITPTDKKGELMDIAMRAMATRPEDRFPDVKQFQAAIREYQSHSESVLLSNHADADLKQANESNNYESFSRAVFGYQQAIELWSANRAAVAGLARAKLDYAECAFQKGDLDLSLSLLDKTNSDHDALRGKLVAAQKEREARHRRLVLLRRLAAGLAASVFVLVVGASILINQQKEKALESEAQARIAEQKALSSEATARTAEAEAIASEAKAKASEANAKISEAHAIVSAREAREAEKIARDSERRATEAKEAEEYQAYIARIGLAASQIEKNAFDAARKTLNDCRPGAGDKRDLRNWEWGRLDYLCSQAAAVFTAVEPVDALAIDVAGNRFASGGSSGQVQIWSREAEQAITLDYDFGRVNALAFSPDGLFLAIGCSRPDGYLQLWDSVQMKPVAGRKFEGHTGSVLSVSFSKEGHSLLTSSSDKSARIWNVATGALDRSFFEQTGWVWSAEFSPDESSIVTAGQDARAIVYDLTGQGTPKKFHGHDKSPVYSAKFTRDGTAVISAGQDGRILLWRPDEIEDYRFDSLKDGLFQDKVRARNAIIPTPKFKEFRLVDADAKIKPVRSLAISKDGNHLASCGDDNTIRIWNIATREMEKQIRGHGSVVRSSSFLPDGHRLLSASHDRTIREWVIDSFTEVRTLFEGHVDAVLAASYSPDQRWIVTASGDRSARIWNTASGKLEQEFGKDDQAFDATDSGQVRPKNEFREGHLFLVSSAQFFPDGRQLLTAAADNTARVWDVERGGQSLLLENTGRAAAIAISNNLQWIATGGGRVPSAQKPSESLWSAQLWNAATGEHLKTFSNENGHNWEVAAVAFSPDNRLLATGDVMGHIRLWDLESGAVVGRLDGHGRYKISAMAFLEDGLRLATASYDNTVMQWDVKSGKEIKSLMLPHPDSVLAMQIIPSTNRIVTSCTEQKSIGEGKTEAISTLRYWDGATGKLLATSTPFAGTAQSISVSGSGEYVNAANSETGDVLTWSLTDPKQEVTKLLSSPSRSDLRSVVLHPDGHQIVTIGGSDALLWDLSNPQKPSLVKSFSQHLTVASARFSPNGKRIATGGLDKTARVWDIQTKRVIRKLEGEQGHKGRVNSTVFSRDSAHLLTASTDGTAKLWNIDTGEVVFTLVNRSGPDEQVSPINSATFSGDGEWIATASEDGKARLWSVRTQECVRTFSGHQAGVVCLEFTTDGAKLVTGSKDKTARLWDVATGTVELIFEGHTEEITSVAISHDMLRVLTGSADDSAKLWDAKLVTDSEAESQVATVAASSARRATEILTLIRHKNDVTSVAFSPDGLQILTGSLDRTAVIWLARDWR
ncbi:protein kinase [Schlesneria sp. T3-172]|uniref:protein kinase domain-containing protein n=1 Tax=Schlesneria sphaerica TaxID=3373610 RepID=UPI0037CB8086